MLHLLRSRAVFPSLLSLACAGSVLAACGSGAKHTAGTTSGSGGSTSASTGTGGTGGSGQGGGIDLGDGGTTQVLTVTPGTTTITITNKMAPVMQTFTALLDGAPLTGAVTWTLDSYAEGSISAAGVFTTTGLVGGTANVTATYGSLTATAALTVDVQLTETVLQSPTDPGPSGPDTTALMGTPLPIRARPPARPTSPRSSTRTTRR